MKDFILKYLGYDTNIVFFEHEEPKCPYCDISMSKNGTKSIKTKNEKYKDSTIHLS